MSTGGRSVFLSGLDTLVKNVVSIPLDDLMVGYLDGVRLVILTVIDMT